MSKPRPDLGYREWVGKRRCLVPRPPCGGKLDLHHVRGRRFGDWIEGTGNLVGLCHHHHMAAPPLPSLGNIPLLRSSSRELGKRVL